MASELILYGTDHCTLCEEALELLLSMPEVGGRTLRVVDVATDGTLLEALGDRIPVLDIRQASRAVRLEWPFDASAIVAALG